MPATGEPPTPDGEGLTSFAEDLEAGAGRRRRGTARRRGRVLHEGVVHEDEPTGDAEAGPERARVRSEAHEGPLPPADEAEVAPARLLGADGTPLTDPDTSPRAGPAAASSPEHSGPARHPAGHATVVDPSVFLVMAVRSYLDGLDRYGQDDPRTVDRLARLRETLAVYDGDLDG